MHVLTEIAQNIAESASGVIGCEVLVTDDKGIIIGCSDKKRLNDLHEPSLDVMKKGVPAETSMEAAAGMQKVKPGYTLPIQILNKTIGSISIAGHPQEVARYGLLVQKQAEIMLREQAYMQSSFLRERALSSIVDNIAFFSGESGGRESIMLQASEAGFNLDRCRLTIIVETREMRCGGGQAAFQTMERELRSVFASARNIICPQERYKFTIFFAPSWRSGDTPEESATSLCNEFVGNMQAKGIDVNMSIGPAGTTLADLADSLRAARAAMRIGSLLGVQGVIEARNYYAEMMVDSLPRGRRLELMSKILGPMSMRGCSSELCDTFLAWCDSPFASGEVAERLALHRNSLQYRLKKIRQLTGLDPWNFKDAFQLWTAFVLTKLDNGVSPR